LANAEFSFVIASQGKNGGCCALSSGVSWTPAANPYHPVMTLIDWRLAPNCRSGFSVTLMLLP
jgi:hypothetical protein